MTIDSSQLRRLLIRVCLVTLAMRAVSMFSVDVTAAEAGAMLGLTPTDESGPLIGAMMAAWGHVSAGIRGVARVPMVLCDVALVLLAVAFTRVSGWGSLAGLLAGMLLAMTPFGLDEGWRADGTALLSVLSLLPLLLLRRGLRDGRLLWLVASALVFAAGVTLSPMLLLIGPVALVLSLRSVTGVTPQVTALIGWTLAAAAGLGARLALGHGLGPETGLAGIWLADPLLNGGLPTLPDGPLQGFGEGLIALSAGGPTGGTAAWLETAPAPLWRSVAGLALWPLAAWGFWSGRVQPDLAPQAEAVSGAEGAGAGDGWRALGVGGATVIRELGERDWLPLLLGVLASAGWLAFATTTGRPHGVDQALAVGRPLAALLLGVGLTGFAGRAGLATRPASQRFVATMVGLALLIFALGAHHFYLGAQSLERIAARKVARYAAEEIAGKGRLLCLGPAGMKVAWTLDPMGTYDRIRLSSLDLRQADAALAAALAAKPQPMVLAGDRLPLEGPQNDPASQGPLGAALHGTLGKAGYELTEDGHRFLAGVSIRVYGVRPAAAIRPQLYPGKAP